MMQVAFEVLFVCAVAYVCACIIARSGRAADRAADNRAVDRAANERAAAAMDRRRQREGAAARRIIKPERERRFESVGRTFFIDRGKSHHTRAGKMLAQLKRKYRRRFKRVDVEIKSEPGAGADENEDDCSICLAPLDDVVRELPCCRALFHQRCIKPWAIAHFTCPLCRAYI
jgi:hypothetical protein